MPARIRGTVTDVKPVLEVEYGGQWVAYGSGPADFSNASTATYSNAGQNYKYVRFTASGTLTITSPGIVDVLIVGGGGGGSGWNQGVGGNGSTTGGAGGGIVTGSIYLDVGSYTVVVGGAGSGGGSGQGGGGGTYSTLGQFSSTAGGGGTHGNGAPTSGYPQAQAGVSRTGGGYSSTNGLSNSLTGSAVTYGAGGGVALSPARYAAPAGGPAANLGAGGIGSSGVSSGCCEASGTAGSSGVVIVRVRTN